MLFSPKTGSQQELADMIDQRDVTFALGEAGCGKSYVAIAKAAEALAAGTVQNIILCRSLASTSGSLGFLPGSTADKMAPEMNSLLRQLEDIQGTKAEQLMKDGTLEIAEPATLRGRTLNDAFVIFDDAAEATKEDLNLVLTRLGASSKIVICGEPQAQSALMDVARAAANVSGAGVYNFVPTPPRPPGGLAQLIGREISMFVEQTPMQNGMTMVQTIPTNPNDPLLEEIRTAAIKADRVARFVYPNKLPAADPNPKSIDIFIVLHEDGKWRTSLARSGMQNAPKSQPLLKMAFAEVAAIPDVVAQGLTKSATAMKPVRFKPRDNT